eukprot:TRINITY_DN74263_c0_g1_i1.p1 TRINITY_DN74263_c0_g1~~TRINITY_DN74263_c0_g1_i1.p1  ORF type:complete len:461 (+),score=59.87 TRINITY_DN74263_c0_g1_i1:52-1434(+)
MSALQWIFVGLAALAGFLSTPYAPQLLAALDPPLLTAESRVENWGLATSASDASVQPFLIPYDATLEEETKDKLRRRRSSRDSYLEDAAKDWTYGVNNSLLEEVLEYWSTSYSWKAEVEQLNAELPQFVTTLKGLRIHFLHYRGDKEGAAVSMSGQALLLLHGWPGSVLEFRRAAPLLKAHGMDVVVPSLPGYGWSERGPKRGLCPVQMADIFGDLMRRLGYQKYFVQGGDWGSMVATAMGRIFPDSIPGVHLNMFNVAGLRQMLGMSQLLLPVGGLASERRKIFPLKKFLWDVLHVTGYFHEQATKPHTLGVALSDSPAGLAAWFLEKFAAWTDCKEPCDPRRVVAVDDFLANLNVYWSTGTITSSIMLYREFLLSPTAHQILSDALSVPVGLLEMPAEIFPPPSTWVPWKYLDIVSHTKPTKGGHFAALEQPDIFVKDVVQFMQLVLARGTDKVNSDL